MNDPPSTMLQRLQAGRLSDYTPVIGLAEKKEFHVYIRACRWSHVCIRVCRCGDELLGVPLPLLAASRCIHGPAWQLRRSDDERPYTWHAVIRPTRVLAVRGMGLHVP